MKILLIRFSSFGDVTQTLSVAAALKNQFPQAELHWITRDDFVSLIETHPAVNRVWGLSRKQGLKGLLNLIRLLASENFTHIYDAHNNLRSRVLCFTLTNRWPFIWNRCLAFLTGSPSPFIRRSIRRFRRFLLFNFRVNLFEQPFSGQRDLLEPLQPWGVSSSLPPPPQIFFKTVDQEKIQTLIQSQLGEKASFIALAPSAAHELKRWPSEYWKQVLQMWDSMSFVLLGGPEDTFLEDLAKVNPERIKNWAGKLTFAESGVVISLSQLLIANDTGLLHIAEQLGHPTIALMGPAPFGFPSRYSSTFIMQRELKCRPCSKHGQGPCKNPHFHECLRTITPDEVMNTAKKILLQKQNHQRR